ncbi:MAG TPA: helix-turn-helix domain-containing protein [Geminicoccaceae bacterium]|nr:helix-turn-helix domain-containing protein [Geminicoccaceae bacterium]
MKGYGQFCPIAKAAEILTERWTPLVLRELICGSTRFNELRRGVPLMSASLLSQRLKFLEQEGVIERRAARGGRGFEYHLTEAGRALGPLIMAMGEWGARWVPSRLRPEDQDVALLMWDMHRRVRPESFPRRRTVVAFEFTDAPANKRHWWLVSEVGEADLCLTDPGYEVDLFIVTDVRSMTAVWTGDLSLAAAMASGALEAHGPTDLCRRLNTWLGLSSFAPIRSRSRELAHA